jgi:hypothetical protein
VVGSSGESSRLAPTEVDAAALLRAHEEVLSTVWRVARGRALAGSRPRERSDGRLVWLAVERGGCAGPRHGGSALPRGKDFHP